jgi:hypothetical protein
MQQLTSRATFDQQRQAMENAPIKDRILAMHMSGDPTKQAEAQAMLDANPGLPKADIMRALLDFDQQKASRDHQAQLNPLKLAAEKQRLDTDRSTAAYTEEQRKLVADQRAALVEEARTKQLMDALREDGNVYADGVLTPADSQELSDALVKAGVKDPGERTDILRAIYKRAQFTTEGVDANGNKVKETVPLPKKVALAAALSANNGWLSTAGGSADDAVEAIMNDVREYELANGGKAKLAKAAVDFRNYQQLLERRQKQAPVVPLKPK